MSKIDYQNLSEEQMAQIQEILEQTDTFEETEDTEEKRLLELLETDEKRVQQTNCNCQLVLMHDPLFAGAIRFDEFSEKIVICKDMGWKRHSRAYCDNDLNHIITYMEALYGLKNDKQIDRAIKVVASDNSFHPIREKLLSLKWDGISRLPDALHHFLGVKKTDLAMESIKVFMLGAIARVFNPGCKFELMLCLVGGQGAGKSTFLRFLAMDDSYFTDDIKKLDDDKVFQRLQGHWIAEMPEMLAVLNAKRVEDTKSFVSRQYDNYRTPYETYAVDHPRQCVFAGTSNNTQFLSMDKSGNRRFLPVEVNMSEAECHILDDEAASREYIEQLWAEIMTIYLSGDYSLVLPKKLNDDLLRLQEKHCPEDPIEIAIRNFLDEKVPEYVCVKMLYHEALNHVKYKNPAQWESTAIGEIMDQKMTDYKRISSHYFKEYGTQRAWGLVKAPGFKPVDKEKDADNPFLC